MHRLTPFEFRLLEIARGFASPGRPRQLADQSSELHLPPDGLSSETLRLLADTLAKSTLRRWLVPQPPGRQLLGGAVSERGSASQPPPLGLGGGWRRETYLRGGRPVSGLLWERTPPSELGLRFGPATLEVLLSLAVASPDSPPRWPPAETWSSGDHWVVFLAYERIRDQPLGDSWRTEPIVLSNPLCRLTFTSDFTAGQAVDVTPDWTSWLAAGGELWLELWQGVLAARWVSLERSKGRLTDPPRVLALGRAQDLLLEGLLDALEDRRRPDLATFLLAAARALLTADARPREWIGQLQLSRYKLSQTLDVYHASFAFLAKLERLQAWDRSGRAARHFDDDYSVWKFWQEIWERYEGETLCRRGREIRSAADPLEAGGAVSPWPAARGSTAPHHSAP